MRKGSETAEIVRLNMYAPMSKKCALGLDLYAPTSKNNNLTHCNYTCTTNSGACLPTFIIGKQKSCCAYFEQIMLQIRSSRLLRRSAGHRLFDRVKVGGRASARVKGGGRMSGRVGG